MNVPKEIMISKTQAIEALRDGNKIAHDLFDEGEFLDLDGAFVVDQNNYLYGKVHELETHPMFLNWNSCWYIYPPQNQIES